MPAATGKTGVEAFGACTDISGFGTGYASSMFECNGTEAILTYYESEACSSGDADVSGVMSNSTCHANNKISRCTTEGERMARCERCRYIDSAVQ